MLSTIFAFHSPDCVFLCTFQTELGIKRIFHILLNDTLSNIQVGDLFRRALFALIRKVGKMSQQLEDLCNCKSCRKSLGRGKSRANEKWNSSVFSFNVISSFTVFLRDREKTLGMVELFMVSLEKDIASYGEQDNASGICGMFLLI